MNNNYPFAPENFSLTAEYIRKVKDAVNLALRGKSNNTGQYTLNTGTTSTVVIDNRCNENSVVLVSPTTAHAASHTQHAYIVAGDKQFTVTHQNNGQTDRTFRYVIIG
jgi:hypothetical protein